MCWRLVFALDRLHDCQFFLVQYHAYKLGTKPLPDDFASYLGNIFASDLSFNSPTLVRLLEEVSANGFSNLPLFNSYELKQFLKEMRKNRCADTNRVLAEYVIFGQR